MNDRRQHPRYVVDSRKDALAQDEVKVEVKGELVHLVNFSLGGLCVLSKKHFSPGVVGISCEFGNHGKIDLRGTVVRVEEEGDMWRVAIDLTQIYKLNSLRKG